MRDEQLLAYLKGSCSGRKNRVGGTELERTLHVSGTDLRKLVNQLRRKTHPIASDRSGYFYATTAGEVYDTIRQLKRMAAGLEAAINGLERSMDRFREDEEAGHGYTTAPAAKTVTITNNGTAATGELAITLAGTHATSFELNKTSIADILAGGNATFTVQPKAGLSAGTYTATVKVSGTGVTEKSFNVQFTVKGVTSSLIGDVNGDGTISVSDMQRLYAHLNGTKPLTDTSTADVNNDKVISVSDMQRLYAHISGKNPLS